MILFSLLSACLSPLLAVNPYSGYWRYMVERQPNISYTDPYKTLSCYCHKQPAKNNAMSSIMTTARMQCFMLRIDTTVTRLAVCFGLSMITPTTVKQFYSFSPRRSPLFLHIASAFRIHGGCFRFSTLYVYASLLQDDVHNIQYFPALTDQSFLRVISSILHGFGNFPLCAFAQLMTALHYLLFPVSRGVFSRYNGQQVSADRTEYL